MSLRRTSAFTLVELLVVIAIIGILVALLLPAVQAARESGRRSACSNNLKQLAVGVHVYESTHKMFPPAGVGYGWCSSGSGGSGSTNILNMSGWVVVLPFIEESAVADKLDQSQAFSSQATGYCCGFSGNQNGTLAGNPATNGNGRTMSVRIDTFVCPSDSAPRLQGPSAPYGPASGMRGSRTNYDFIASRSDSGLGANGCNYWSRAAGHVRYPFGENSNTRMSLISDGTSNTFMVGECTARIANGEPNCWGYRGWVMTGVDPNGGINIWDVPTSTNRRTRGNLNSWGQAGSMHPNGCLFALCDGSVRFVNELAASTTLLRLSRMSDSYSPTLDNLE